MIFDSLDHSDRYAGLNDGILRVLEYAKNIKAESFPKGRDELDGKNLFINFADYETHDAKDGLAEAHRLYADVMVMIDGEETVFVKDISRVEKVEKEYDSSIDAMLTRVDGDYSEIKLKTGMFLVLFPEDVHAPGCNLGGVKKVRKIIGKVLLK